MTHSPHDPRALPARDPTHRHHPNDVRVAIITVSDTRRPENDESGSLAVARLRDAGHTVLAHHIVPDEPDAIAALISTLCDEGAQAVVLSGGTGIAARDSTFEVVEGMLDKSLPGFGELFRMLSYQEIGSAAMLSRATAGVVKGHVVISLPGSPNAVALALDKLVLPELGHMVKLARCIGEPLAP